MTTKITKENLDTLSNMGVDWQTVHVADGSTALTVSPGKGYFIDTTSAAQVVNFPAGINSNVGDTIKIKDYARTFATNNVTTNTTLFEGVSIQETFKTNGLSITCIYTGSAKGWQLTNDDTVTQLGAKFGAATGGTETTSGNFKIHSFTGDGNFVVSCSGNTAGANKFDYLVVAGGGGANDTGGGGAGGFRLSAGTDTGCYVVPSPLAGSVAALTLPAATYPITVGGGGGHGGTGSNSVFSTITSAGGGNGAHGSNGTAGGSGGAAGYQGGSGGAGNTPPVSPPQGNNGGNSPGPQTSPFRGAGGGGAGSVGSNQPGGAGGTGAETAISGSDIFYAGGGGGAGTAGAGGAGGSEVGGNAGSHPEENGVCGENGVANRGGGGGAASGLPSRGTGGSGGKGVVVIRYKFQAG